MHLQDREHFFHRLAAGSAFAFALCVLPAINYAIISGQTPESGKVAGVSTDKTVVAADQATPSPVPVCGTERDKALADLQAYQDGQHAHLKSVYDAAVAPYQAALKQVTGTPAFVQDQQDGFAKLIGDKTTDYADQLSKVDSAVESQKETLLSAACPE